VLSAKRTSAPPRWAYLVAPAIAALMLVVTLLWAGSYGMGLRDPDGVVGARLVLVFALVAILWALDVVPRAVRDARRTQRPMLARVVAVARERWSLRRVAIVLGTIVAFYVTYLCYRNIKSYVPLARPEIVDAQLLDFELSVLGEHPARLLHDLLGTGIAAHALSTIYLLFLTFVPLSVALALVWRTDMASGLFWVAVLSLNWVFGAASYFVLPSLGPVFTSPELFGALPDTGVSALQATLLEHREAFLAAPVASGDLQSIGAFASLHVSIVLSGALTAQLLGAPRALRVTLWVYLALTWLATIYFGWHFLVDDLGGIAIALMSVFGGAWLTGWRLERSRAAQTTALATQ
jgi:hypothetical protein